MNAEVISIGDELTSGQRLDTNSQWLSQQLAELGVTVKYHTTVADDLQANVDVFRAAVERVDVVVSTGGLGPTADDLTREALAAASGQELVLDEGALEHIRALFARRRRPMPERNTVQAMLPAGGRVIPNPHGTAPGVALELARARGGTCRVYALPGVPAEMHQMWAETVALELIALSEQPRVIRHRRLKCFGVGESDLEAMLPDLISRGREPTVGITVHEATITLRVAALGATAEACDQIMLPTLATMRELLGELVFGEEDDELEDIVLRRLADRGQTLATVECGTAGLIAEYLQGATDPAGCYRGGLVLADAESAARLGIGGQVAPNTAPTSRAFVEETARAAKTRFATDFVLCTGAFPTAAVEAGQPPPFYFALAGPEGVTTKASPFAGHPAILKARAAKQALNLLRLSLSGV